MKKIFLFGLSGFAVLITIIVSSAGNSGVRNAYFIFDDGHLAIQSQVNPLFADVLFTDLDLQPLQSTVEKLLTEGLVISMDGQTYKFPAQMKDLVVTKEDETASLSLNQDFLDYVLDELAKIAYVAKTDINLLSADETKVSKVTMEGTISDGKELITELTDETIRSAIEKGETQATALTRTVNGKIINETGKDLGPLELISTGKSNFSESIGERTFNVRKALNEHFDGILIPPGAEFSYVAFLGEITNTAGWKNALTIFKTTELNWVPGGGICQVSTTVYRAALRAALPVTDQRNHSLYITYYQDYGDGLDATVFPGEQDLKFINDTPNYILMVAQEEGTEKAVVRFYGQDDGRKTELYGPYTASNQTDEVATGVGAPLGIGQIAWKYIITHADGTTEEKWLLSDYHSIVKQWKDPVIGPLVY